MACLSFFQPQYSLKCIWSETLSNNVSKTLSCLPDCVLFKTLSNTVWLIAEWLCTFSGPKWVRGRRLGKVIWPTGRPWKGLSRVVVPEEHLRKNSIEQRKGGNLAYVKEEATQQLLEYLRWTLRRTPRSSFLHLHGDPTPWEDRLTGQEQHYYDKHVLYFPLPVVVGFVLEYLEEFGF